MAQDLCSANIVKSKYIDVSECLKEAHLNQIEKTLLINSILSRADIDKILYYVRIKLNEDLYTQFLKRAPLNVLWRYFEEKHCLEGVMEIKKGNDKGPSNILDTMHAMVALSYCDYFITNDDKLRNKCLEIINKLELGTKILRFDSKNHILVQIN